MPLTRFVGHLVQKHLEQQKFVVRSNHLYGVRSFCNVVHVHAVMNALHCVENVHREFFCNFDILPVPSACKMTADKGVKLVRQQLIENLDVLMKVRGDVKPLERSITVGSAVNGHQEFSRWDINEEVTLIRMIIMGGEIDTFAAKGERLSRFKSDVRYQPIRIVHSLQKVADRI